VVGWKGVGGSARASAQLCVDADQRHQQTAAALRTTSPDTAVTQHTALLLPAYMHAARLACLPDSKPTPASLFRGLSRTVREDVGVPALSHRPRHGLLQNGGVQVALAHLRPENAREGEGARALPVLEGLGRLRGQGQGYRQEEGASNNCRRCRWRQQARERREESMSRHCSDGQG